MKGVIEIKKSKQLDIIIDNEMDNYDNKVLFPEKLQEANETLVKYGIPEKWANELAQTGQKHSFWTIGLLKSADAVENSFSIVVKSKDNNVETTYNIFTSAQTLSKLVKEHWHAMIKVHIQPTNLEMNPIQYDLIEGKAV